MCKNSCNSLFLGLYFCELDFSPFTADQDASKLAVVVCSPFDCFCASTRSHPLPLRKFLAVVCSRYFSLEKETKCLRTKAQERRRRTDNNDTKQVKLALLLPGSAASFTLRRFCLTRVCSFRRCCVVHAGALVISLRLLLTTKMVSMHVHFPSSGISFVFLCYTVCFCSL